ncbi:HEAT repeat domain-containing protein [Blastopirellula marina]|uniref:HEAT repeat domain-containing protein n=1 Tax=Blastopirellula marina TaxID=124 RepID=A0A2S8GS14_9BACT|nr:HEAT repeat domain-containing protein [Blastopirellula marina]PQO47219.1 hypothetical protein C5Y93_04045 [Blastopirellula marina]
MFTRPWWLLGLLALTGCFGTSETKTIPAAGGTTAPATSAIDVPADNPAIQWSQMEFDELPEVVVEGATPPPQPFSGEDKPDDTPIPDDVQRLLDTYDEKNFDKLADLALTYPQKKVRAGALTKIASFAGSRTGEAMQLMRVGVLDEDPKVRKEMLSSIRNGLPLWDKQQCVCALPELAEALHKHSDDGFGIGLILEDYGPAALPVLPQLCWALGHEKKGVVSAIGNIGPEAKVAIPLVAQFAWKEESLDAADALGKLQAEDLVMKLLESSEDRQVWMGASAAKYLNEIPPPMVQRLLAAISRADRSVRASAAEALGKVRPSTPEIAGALMTLPPGDVDWVDEAVYMALAQLDPPSPEALEHMNSRLAATDDQGRREVIQKAISLWKTQNKQPVESLLQDVIAADGAVDPSFNAQADELYEPLIKIAGDAGQPANVRAAALMMLDATEGYLQEGRSDKVDEIAQLAAACAAEKPEQPLLGAAAHVVYRHSPRSPETEQLFADGVATAGFLKQRTDDLQTICIAKVEPGLPVVIDLLNKPETSVMEVMLRNLSFFGEKAAAAAPGITKLPIDPNDKDQLPLFQRQMEALGAIGGDPAVCIPFYKKTLAATDPSMWERGEILEAWAKTVAASDGDPNDVLAECDAVLSSPTGNKLAALNALTAMGPKSAPLVPKIIPCLENTLFGMNACKALEAIGPPAKEAEPQLIKAAHEWKDNGLPLRALCAIHASGPEFAQLVAATLEIVADRPFMLELLSRMGPDAAPFVPQIAKLLDSEAVDERARAAKTLGAIGPGAKSQVKRLQKMATEDESYTAKSAAKKALEQIAPEAAAEKAE